MIWLLQKLNRISRPSLTLAKITKKQKPNDLGGLDDMTLRAKKILGVDELKTLADKGYHKADDLKKCAEYGFILPLQL